MEEVVVVGPLQQDKLVHMEEEMEIMVVLIPVFLLMEEMVEEELEGEEDQAAIKAVGMQTR